jgi:hypothetical protein
MDWNIYMSSNIHVVCESDAEIIYEKGQQYRANHSYFV